MENSVWNGTASTDWHSKDPAAGIFTISTAEELAGLARIVNNGESMKGKTIKLEADIALNDTTGWENWDENTEGLNQWVPIGNSYRNCFQGTFDGNGCVISGVYINSADCDRIHKPSGLFGAVAMAAIENLGVISSYINNSGHETGGLAGCFGEGTISKCYFKGNVYGGYDVGGLIGVGFGSIADSYFMGNARGKNYIGGLAGLFRGTINNSYAAGCAASASGGGFVGGLMGCPFVGSKINSYYNSETTAQSDRITDMGKTTEQMRGKDMYIGWDFEKVWGVTDRFNNGMPYLRWQREEV